jgi:hypothetical protein
MRGRSSPKRSPTSGSWSPFFHRSAEDIDRLIEAAVTGYIDSMQDQAARKERTGTALDDPIPF